VASFERIDAEKTGCSLANSSITALRVASVLTLSVPRSIKETHTRSDTTDLFGYLLRTKVEATFYAAASMNALRQE
jgi:hypothetical protein